MKKLLFFITILSIGFFACKKESEPATPAVESMEYSINGLSDFEYNFKTVSIPISLLYSSGPQEKVNLTITGLPAGMKGTFSAASGTPTFSTVLEISHDAYIANGIYMLKVIGTDTKGKIKTIDVKVTVLSGCGDFMAGRYRVVSSYPSGTIFSTTEYTLYTNEGEPNKVYFKESSQSSPAFYANFNCTNNTIDIPNQVNIEGDGFFTISPQYIQLAVTYIGLGNATLKCTRL